MLPQREGPVRLTDKETIHRFVSEYWISTTNYQVSVLAALCYHSVKWFSEKKRLAEPCSFIESKRWTGALAACIPGAAEWLNIKKRKHGTS